MIKIVQNLFVFLLLGRWYASAFSTSYGRTWRIPLGILSWGPSIFLPGEQHHRKQLDEYRHSGLCLRTTFCRDLKCHSTQVRYHQGPLLGPKVQHAKMNNEYTKLKEWNKLKSVFQTACKPKDEPAITLFSWPDSLLYCRLAYRTGFFTAHLHNFHLTTKYLVTKSEKKMHKISPWLPQTFAFALSPESLIQAIKRLRNLRFSALGAAYV